MAVELAPIFRKAYYSLVLVGGLYLVFVFAITFPIIQRNALYAHNVNPTLWQDLSDVEAFGFLQHQVQPFTLRTSDNETLYAWHILPLHLAQEHSEDLLQQDDFTVKSSAQVLDTLAFKLLAIDPNAHVVVNFHGNAGHLASSYRPFTYQRLLGLSSKTRPVHVIAFDYRGFGLSTGTPTETGLRTDAETVLNFLTGLMPSHTHQPTLSIPPSNIILTSQSLGTAISTLLLRSWTLSHNLSPPKSLILTSPFSSLPSLIDSYSIKGLIPPLLSPFRSYPFIMNKITSFIADTWRTDQRLAEILLSDRDIPINIHLIHARDDREIPWWETQKIWDSILRTATAMRQDVLQEINSGSVVMDKGKDGTGTSTSNTGSQLQTWRGRRSDAAHEKVLRYTKTQHGGHNRLACSEEVAAAVWRALEC
jgi:pimeloyl-ACP methyl ester carboxylesterase